MSASKHGATFARELIPLEPLLQYLGATPKQWETIARWLSKAKRRLRSAEPTRDKCGMRISDCGIAQRGMRIAESGGAGPRRRCVYRWTGWDWEVIFEGGRVFHLPDILGARYLAYLLHHPNELTSAFDLEVIVCPEKGEARARNSIQPDSDAPARRDYRKALEQLQAQRQEAQAAGDLEKIERLEGEMEWYESLLDERSGANDTGARAYNNVRQRINDVRAHLRKGGPEERAFEEHLRAHLRLGLECMYSQPEGHIWA